MLNLASYKARSTALYADLEAVLAKHGFKSGKITASIDDTGSARVTFNLSDADAEPPHAVLFRKYAASIGMKPEWLGKTFKLTGRTFKIEGMKSRG